MRRGPNAVARHRLRPQVGGTTPRPGVPMPAFLPSVRGGGGGGETLIIQKVSTNQRSEEVGGVVTVTSRNEITQRTNSNKQYIYEQTA